MQLSSILGAGVGLALTLAARTALADVPTPAPTPDATQPTPDSTQPTPDSTQPTPDSTQPTPDSASAAAPDGVPTPASSNVSGRASTEIGGYVDSTATSVLTPSIGATVANPTAGWSASGRYLIDVVSAASPDIVATASAPFKEVRHAGSLGGRYKPGNYGVALGASTSYTPDYFSLSANVQLTQDLDEKNLTLSQGYSYGHDTIGRTGTPFSVFSRSLDYHALSLGASRVVNAGLVIGVTGELIVERGDQSKPYRYIPIFSPEVAARVPRGAPAESVAATRLQARPLEQLPLGRERVALAGRLAWRSGSATLRFDERLYTDSWGLHATTSDARWFFDLSERVMIWPHARFHLQGGVDFWKLAYSATSARDLPALRTGDRELGPLATLGGGGGLRVALGRAGSVNDWVFTTTVDGFWTSFAEAIYVKDRLSALVTIGLEVAF